MAMVDMSPLCRAITDHRQTPDMYLKEYAATTIQKYFRGYRTRIEVDKQVQEYKRQLNDWEQARDLNYVREEAALIIQQAWQSFRNVRIYQYYRDLIQFRERGDPKELLRSINPREAQLADAASGIHVRFRLGGTVFPPLVFYKIYTHRPVTDICSFCPRDYANEVRLTAANVHNKTKVLPVAEPRKNKPKKVFSEDFDLEDKFREYLKPDGTIGIRSTRGWYERAENNGWRPINERILVDEDPVTTMTKLKRMPFFHFSTAVRREEKVRRAKQRKRNWMLKMYREGLLGNNHMSPSGAPSGVGSRSTAGALHGDELDSLDGSLDEFEDGDPNELLQWTQHLDFDHYINDWTSIACTLGTEAFVPELESEYLAQAPPPSHDIHGAMVTAGVPLRPFKSGVSPAAGVVSTLNVA
ncbi:hypothetical protein CEUSTIGMA_g1687.t1 [Chlamydomonas eustigma]|uniref:Uncharacterized protein n=1 Tax=Chlamydomonas eustigma TaxID=1157962 RepID=A0A250WTT0_9CHLO|nr:hypothetical protein CEUSTIGMA_g1687.t1 [Chlamydomonas eustigma]|eukprot:GAX74238.1 hypothetical protein CEUSTIGMA_g1687.t1 [Chlamydomonas eustigma]